MHYQPRELVLLDPVPSEFFQNCTLFAGGGTQRETKGQASCELPIKSPAGEISKGLE
jgi:hypothetical protein